MEWFVYLNSSASVFLTLEKKEKNYEPIRVRTRQALTNQRPILSSCDQLQFTNLFQGGVWVSSRQKPVPEVSGLLRVTNSLKT